MLLVAILAIGGPVACSSEGGARRVATTPTEPTCSEAPGGRAACPTTTLSVDAAGVPLGTVDVLRERIIAGDCSSAGFTMPADNDGPVLVGDTEPVDEDGAPVERNRDAASFPTGATLSMTWRVQATGHLLAITVTKSKAGWRTVSCELSEQPVPPKEVVIEWGGGFHFRYELTGVEFGPELADTGSAPPGYNHVRVNGTVTNLQPDRSADPPGIRVALLIAVPRAQVEDHCDRSNDTYRSQLGYPDDWCVIDSETGYGSHGYKETRLSPGGHARIHSTVGFRGVKATTTTGDVRVWFAPDNLALLDGKHVRANDVAYELRVPSAAE